MISDEVRKTIYVLYKQGIKKKKIARDLNVNIKTVRGIISNNGCVSNAIRSTRKEIEEELLKNLYEQCNGYVQRVHEKLTEEHNIKIAYSTLTKLIRKKGIGEVEKERSPHILVLPGEEMQHDTSPYRIKIGGKDTRAIASGLYLRYSKMRYVQFYPYFNRFMMKCFFYNALMFWKYSATRCVIDNTNLAVLHGTGREAVFNPEMIMFARPYGFEWKAHEINHPNRKAGIERSFYTIETNFFPGRSFESWEDLNKQAFEWATERYAKRPHSQTKLIPIELFEEEKKHLIALPDYIEPPYQEHFHTIDEYGYVSFKGNFYWVPPKCQNK
jgi:hypothetical protein